MFHLDADLKVYLHREAVDFCKSINGLATLVEQSMGRDPFARAVYAFRNRRCDRIKLLLYDRTGFWLLIKRLEQDRFVWPRCAQAVPELTAEQLHWLLVCRSLLLRSGFHASNLPQPLSTCALLDLRNKACSS